MIRTKTMLGVSAMMVLLLAPTGGETKVPSQTEGIKVPNKLLAKVFFTNEKIKDQTPQALALQFEKSPAKGEAKRGKKGRWTVTLVAFFKKITNPGPITIWVYDRADKESLKAKEPIQAISVDTSAPKEIFIHDLDLDPDLGYNKGRVYLVQVGQIIAKQEKIFAAGDLVLTKD